MKPQKKFPKNLHKKEIFLIFVADLKHKKMGIYKYQAEIICPKATYPTTS